MKGLVYCTEFQPKQQQYQQMHISVLKLVIYTVNSYMFRLYRDINLEG